MCVTLLTDKLTKAKSKNITSLAAVGLTIVGLHTADNVIESRVRERFPL